MMSSSISAGRAASPVARLPSIQELLPEYILHLPEINSHRHHYRQDFPYTSSYSWGKADGLVHTPSARSPTYSPQVEDGRLPRRPDNNITVTEIKGPQSSGIELPPLHTLQIRGRELENYPHVSSPFHSLLSRPSLPPYSSHADHMYFSAISNARARIPAPRDDERRHACPHCDKRFNRPSSLAIHINTHTGAKPFTCPYSGCGRRFNVNSNMRRHLRNHTTSAQPPLRFKLQYATAIQSPPLSFAPKLAPFQSIEEPASAIRSLPSRSPSLMSYSQQTDSDYDSVSTPRTDFEQHSGSDSEIEGSSFQGRDPLAHDSVQSHPQACILLSGVPAMSKTPYVRGLALTAAHSQDA